MSEQRIGDLLVEYEVVTREELERIMRDEIKSGPSRLASRLFNSGAVPEADLCRALAHRCAHPAIVFARSVLDLDALEYLPLDQAEAAVALPIAVDDETLTLASHDLEPQALIEQLSFVSGKVVSVVLGLETTILAAIRDGYAARERGESIRIGRIAVGTAPKLELMYGGAVPNESELAKLVDDLVGGGTGGRGNAIGRIALKRVPVEVPVVPAPLPPEEVTKQGGGAFEFSATDFGADDHDDELELELDAGAVLSAPATEAPDRPPRTGLFEAPDDLATLPAPKFEAVVETRPTRILVADDDESIQRMIVNVLKRDGYALEAVGDGHDAVEAIKRAPPDLVILDGMMPGMHGFELCKHLKSSEAYQDIVVIIVTAMHKGIDSARVVQEEYGADAFLEKPFEIQMLRKMVARFVGKTLDRVPLPEDKRAQISQLRDQIDEHALLGEWNPAQTLVERWLAVDPFDPRAHLVSGNLQCQQRHLPLAMRSYETSVVFGEEIFETWVNLSLVYERLGFRGKAVVSWRKALELATPEAKERIERRLARLKA